MIASHGRDGTQVQRGMQHHLRSASGASAARIIEAANSVVAEHHHDWPVLTLYVMGDGVRLHDRGEVRLNRPSIALHAAGELHANVISSAGLEQIDVQFDPAWLRSFGASAPLQRSGIWMGGRISAGARALGRQWADANCTEAQLAKSTAQLLQAAFHCSRAKDPPWLKTALSKIERGEVQSIKQLARRLGLHPGWLAQSYRAAVGEGLAETILRRRIERAALLLRTTELPAAAVAADTGFCDQSHMIRAFQRLLGRSPTRVRSERNSLDGQPTDSSGVYARFHLGNGA